MVKYDFKYAYAWRDIEADGLGHGTFDAQNDEEAKQSAHDMLAGEMNPYIFVSVMRGGRFVVAVWNTSKVAAKLRSLTDMRGKVTKEIAP